MSFKTQQEQNKYKQIKQAVEASIGVHNFTNLKLENMKAPKLNGRSQYPIKYLKNIKLYLNHFGEDFYIKIILGLQRLIWSEIVSLITQLAGSML